MNTRRKGQRTQAKALAYAKSLSGPKDRIVELHQRTPFATPQPFDFFWFRPSRYATLVEVRSNQYGMSKPQTVELTHLPGFVYRQIWMFKDRATIPHCRQWSEANQAWLPLLQRDL